jgi:hypothetical protein
MRVNRHISAAVATAVFWIAAPVGAQDAPALEELRTVSGAYIGCLRATVQMGMTTKMDPGVFKEGFAKSCMEQEALFRAAAIKAFVAQGRTEEQAVTEVDGNIVKGRRIFAGDQETYVRTGKVPH